MKKIEKPTLKQRLAFSYRRIELLESIYTLLYDLETRLNERIDRQYAKKFAQLVNEFDPFFTPIFSSLHFQLMVELNSMLNEKKFYSLNKLVDEAGSEELKSDLEAMKNTYRELLQYIGLWRNKLYAHYCFDTPDDDMKGFSYEEMYDLISDVKKLIIKVHTYSVDEKRIVYWKDAFAVNKDATNELISRLHLGSHGSLLYEEYLNAEKIFIAKRDLWRKEN